MKVTEFRKTIQERAECHPEWTYGIDQCWEREIAFLTEDIPSTIEFLKNECTADEYSWISEVLDDIIEETSSKELLECYKALMTKFPDECERYNISGVIELCESILEWETKDGKE